MAKTTAQKLSALGYSMTEAQEYVLAMVGMGQAQALAHKVASIGIDAQDLANIVNVQKQEVVDYFHYSGVDTNLLNAGATGMSLTTDAYGDVYLFDPHSGKSKLVVQLGLQNALIGDIATDTNGDIYISSALGGLYRYDFSEQKVEKLNFNVGDGYSLGFFGDILVSGMASQLHLTTKDGVRLADMTVPFPASDAPPGVYSDLLVIGNKLYRNGAGGFIETDIDTGVSKEITQVFNFVTTGLVNGGDGWIIGYTSQIDVYKDDVVIAYNVNTQEAKTLSVWDETPYGRSVMGASEALQMHVDLWGMNMA